MRRAGFPLDAPEYDVSLPLNQSAHSATPADDARRRAVRRTVVVVTLLAVLVYVGFFLITVAGQ